MQERQGQSGDSWDRASSQRIASLNGTGKHRPLPQRPAGLPRVDHPPVIPRVERPQRQHPQQNTRQRLLILGSVFLVCALLACGIGYTAFNYFNGLGTSLGAAGTTVDFLKALNDRDYKQAYTDLGASITIQLTPEEFEQQGQINDRCYGLVTGYSEVSGSATSENGSQSYLYTITRSKSKPYQLRLTLQPDQETSGSWKITSYGNSLGPAQPSPTCK